MAVKNSFGSSITLTLFGESHGLAVGAVLDGLCPGMPVDEETIAALLSRRRPSSGTDTARREPDAFQLVSGIWQGKTTGTPLCILIPNQEQHSGDYSVLLGKARPAHADFAAYCKYHGYEDARGGGHFSGRLLFPENFHPRNSFPDVPAQKVFQKTDVSRASFLLTAPGSFGSPSGLLIPFCC